MNIEIACKRINAIRLTGGKYSTIELKEALKGLPYYGYIPTAMRNHRNLNSYTVTTRGIIFNPKVSLYKDVIITILKEAQEMGKKSVKPNFYKLLAKYTDEELPKTPLGLQRFVESLCVKLYYEGKSVTAAKLLQNFKKYESKNKN